LPSTRGAFTAPKVLYQVDPEFSEEARRARHYGTVLLVVDVDTTGRAVNFRIAKSLGLGLDEKAIEAVSRWKFQPGRRDGKPVTVPATIQVNFHLL
jgi:TonB family C-terminal domain